MFILHFFILHFLSIQLRLPSSFALIMCQLQLRDVVRHIVGYRKPSFRPSFANPTPSSFKPCTPCEPANAKETLDSRIRLFAIDILCQLEIDGKVRLFQHGIRCAFNEGVDGRDGGPRTCHGGAVEHGGR